MISSCFKILLIFKLLLRALRQRRPRALRQVPQVLVLHRSCMCIIRDQPKSQPGTNATMPFVLTPPAPASAEQSALHHCQMLVADEGPLSLFALAACCSEPSALCMSSQLLCTTRKLISIRLLPLCCPVAGQGSFLSCLLRQSKDEVAGSAVSPSYSSRSISSLVYSWGDPQVLYLSRYNIAHHTLSTTDVLYTAQKLQLAML